MELSRKQAHFLLEENPDVKIDIQLDWKKMVKEMGEKMTEEEVCVNQAPYLSEYLKIDLAELQEHHGFTINGFYNPSKPECKQISTALNRAGEKLLKENKERRDNKTK